MRVIASLGLASTAIVAAANGLAAAPRDDARAHQEHIERVREELLLRRDAAIETRLRLEGSQAREFQAIKRAFDRDEAALGRRGAALIREFSEVYDRLDAPSAAAIAERFFELQRDRLALEQACFERMAQRVSPVIAVQFLQLHRRYELEIQRMTYAPLAE